MYYFEVGQAHIKNMPSIRIGYSDIKEEKHLFKDVSTEFLATLENNKTLGCGLLLQPRKQLVLTSGIKPIWMAPLSELLDGERLSDEKILDLVPYVSVENVDVNIGQKCFVYEPANSNKAKQKFLSFVLESIDKEDR